MKGGAVIKLFNIRVHELVCIFLIACFSDLVVAGKFEFVLVGDAPFGVLPGNDASVNAV